MMAAVVVMRALRRLHLLLQRRQRLLRLTHIAGLQCIADLADSLGKWAAALTGRRLRERRIGVLRDRQVTGLKRIDQLAKGLTHRIDRWREVRWSGRNRRYRPGRLRQDAWCWIRSRRPRRTVMVNNSDFQTANFGALRQYKSQRRAIIYVAFMRVRYFVSSSGSGTEQCMRRPSAR